MKTFVMLAAFIAIGANGGSLESNSKVWVDGTSTVRGFKCSATEMKSDVTKRDAGDLAALVEQAQVVIPVGKLDCGNGTMNEHMRKALKAASNPNIEFALHSYDVTGSSAVLKGSLTIAGTTKEIEIPATIQQQGEIVRVQATAKIKMTEWGVKPPSLMMGTMKVREDVTVGFDVALKR